MKTVVVVTALLLSGCVPSLQPFYSESSVIYDPSLPGTWSTKDGVTLTCTGAPNNTYKVVYKSRSEAAVQFMARLILVRGVRFADIYPGPGTDTPGCFPCLPVHMAVKIVSEGDTLRIRYLDAEWFKKMVARGQISIAHEMYDRDYLLTASPFVLRSLLSKYADDAQAFHPLNPFFRSHP